jgi:TfoX/Sxy family transcriptional regulator of competence genes
MDADGKQVMPKWRSAPPELVRTFGEAVKPLPGVEVRKMFGYPCAFYNGQMFAGLHQESMILRLSSDDRAGFLALPGATPFEPMAGRPMREYVVVPASVVDDPSELTPWLDRALAYAASLPPKVAKPKGKKSAKA